MHGADADHAMRTAATIGDESPPVRPGVRSRSGSRTQYNCELHPPLHTRRHHATSVAHAIAVAFSPDRQEMFVARHFSGGFQSLLYQPATDSWTPTTVVAGPQAGGIATTVHFYSTYGTACFGANGEPTLLGYGLPIPGNTVSLRVQRGVPAAYGTIVMSLQPGNVPVAGCTWWQTMIVGNTDLFALDGTGRYDLNIRLPGHLVPMDFYFQAFLLDATSPSGLFSTTAGLRASPQ